MRLFKHLPLFSICFLIACAPIKQPGENPLAPTTPTAQSSALKGAASTKTTPQAISAWELSGAIAARNKNKSWTASINWVQEAQNQYQIRLYGPLGSGTVLIEKHGNVITYRDGPKKISSTNADQLLLEQTGVRLPVSHLYYWVKGLPAPEGVTSKRVDANKQLSQLQQAGYNVTYLQYMMVNGTLLPSKIRLQGHGVMIKMVIKHWKI